MNSWETVPEETVPQITELAQQVYTVSSDELQISTKRRK
jgi:hypothetical protein